MTYEQYWYGDVWMVEAYREADKRKRQSRSEEMWLMGGYNFRAFTTALSNLHFDGKQHKVNTYPDEVIRVIPYTQAEKAAIAERERQKTIDYFNRLAAKWEKQNKPE